RSSRAPAGSPPLPPPETGSAPPTRQRGTTLLGGGLMHAGGYRSRVGVSGPCKGGGAERGAGPRACGCPAAATARVLPARGSVVTIMAVPAHVREAAPKGHIRDN